MHSLEAGIYLQTKTKRYADSGFSLFHSAPLRSPPPDQKPSGRASRRNADFTFGTFTFVKVAVKRVLGRPSFRVLEQVRVIHRRMRPRRLRLVSQTAPALAEPLRPVLVER